MQEDSRVVLLSNRSLLSVSVAMLLQKAEGVELTIVAADDQEAVSNIKQYTPQTIMIDSGDAFVDERIIIRLLEEYPQVRIIVLNVNHENIKIYQMKHLIQTDIKGLLDTIRGT